MDRIGRLFGLIASKFVRNEPRKEKSAPGGGTNSDLRFLLGTDWHSGRDIPLSRRKIGLVPVTQSSGLANLEAKNKLT